MDAALDSGEVQRRRAPADGMHGVMQRRELAAANHQANGGAGIAVIVIAEDGEFAIGGAELTQRLDEVSHIETEAPRGKVPGDRDDIRVVLVRHSHGRSEACARHTAAHVDVADLHDGVAVESRVEMAQRHRDLVRVDPVRLDAVGIGQCPRGEARRAEQQMSTEFQGHPFLTVCWPERAPPCFTAGQL